MVSFQNAHVRYRIALDRGPEVEAVVGRSRGKLLATGSDVWVCANPSAVQVLPLEVSA